MSIAAVLALLFLGVTTARADPVEPDPHPVDPAATDPSPQYVPCFDGCDSSRFSGPDQRDPAELNPQPLPPGRR